MAQNSEYDEAIDELAQRLVDLIPWLRSISAASEPIWLRLHLRIVELGGYTPVEASILQQIVDGLAGTEILEDQT